MACFKFLNQFNGYSRSDQYPENGKTVTDALNHTFFDPLIKFSGVQGDFDPHAYIDDVVVSFFSHTNEERPITFANTVTGQASSDKQLRCRVCNAKAAHFNTEEDGTAVPLCGDQCAEFRYIYNEKTMFC